MPCDHVKQLDGTQVLVCSRGERRRRRCASGLHPTYSWGRWAPWAAKLCDYPMPGGKTCDKPLCEACAVNVGSNRDYCPEHARNGQAEMGL